MTNQDQPLTGVWAKIKRAEKHIKELDEARGVFVDSHPYKFISSVNPKTGHHEISVLEVQPIPLEIPVIIGDVIHNLRSALDLLACQLIKRRNPSHTCKDVYFPISDGPDKYETALKRKEIGEMGPDAVDIFVGLQAYKGGQGEALWQIHQLSIRDKHRFLIVAGAGLKSWIARHINTRIFPESTESPYYISAVIPGEDVIMFNKGDKILAVDPGVLAPNPGDIVKVDLKFPGTISFNESGVIVNKPVMDILLEFVKTVKNTAMLFALLFSEIDEKHTA